MVTFPDGYVSHEDCDTEFSLFLDVLSQCPPSVTHLHATVKTLVDIYGIDLLFDYRELDVDWNTTDRALSRLPSLKEVTIELWDESYRYPGSFDDDVEFMKAQFPLLYAKGILTFLKPSVFVYGAATPSNRPCSI